MTADPAGTSEMSGPGPMTVTVVIPALNAAGTLAATLDSLLAQDWTDWRAIVVEDRSTDATAAVASHYAARDARIEVIEGPGKGVGAARNTALRRATSPWVLFLDSDDTISPSMLRRMMAVLSDDPQADAVHCGWTFTDPDGNEIGQGRCTGGPDVFPEFARYCAFAIHACIFRRGLLDRAGLFEETMSTCEDFDLWQRMARLGARFEPLAETLVTYRLRPRASWFRPEVFLTDALTVVRRGHAEDPRLDPAAIPKRNRAGAPASGLGTAEFGMLAWAAASAIAAGRDTAPMMQLLPVPGGADIDIGGFADALYRGIPLARCQPVDRWPEIWPETSAAIERFLDGLGSGGRIAPGAQIWRALEMRVARAAAEAAEPRATRTFGGVAAVRVDADAAMGDCPLIGVDRAVVSVFHGGKALGTIELPVFDGAIPAAVVKDAIAARWAWQLLDGLFSVQVYPDLDVGADEDGWKVARGGAVLGRGTGDAPAGGALHGAVGWAVFVQELTGRPDWTLERLYDPSEDEPECGGEARTPEAGRAVPVELGGGIAPVAAEDDSPVVIEATIGGAPVFRTEIEPVDGMISGGRLRAILLDRGKLELARIAVREGIVGYGGDANLSLNERLKAAAAQREGSALAASGSVPSWAAAAIAGDGIGASGTTVIGGAGNTEIAGYDRRAALPSHLAGLFRGGLRPGQPMLDLGDGPITRCLYLPELRAVATPARLPASEQDGAGAPSGANHRSHGDRHHFEKLFAKGADPWKYTSPYEQTKYEQTLAMLPSGLSNEVLEIGCAEGHFTRQLAPRCRKLVASDISDIALARAAERCADQPNITYRQLDLVADEIPGTYDVIVCSEILYYMGGLAEMGAVAAKLRNALKPGGVIVTAHARLVVDDPDRTGFDWRLPYGARKIGEAFAAVPGLYPDRELRTELYLIQRFRAQSTGLAALIHRPRKEPAVVEADHALPEPDVARHILWGGGEVAADLGPLRTTRVPILMYHSVAESGPAALSRWRVTPDVFDAQIRYLARSGFEPATLSEWRMARETNTPLEGRRVILTFDDAYCDFEENALPVLQRYGFTAIMYAPVNLIGKRSEWDSWSGGTLPITDWDGLKRLRDAGIEIGAHSLSHRPLAALDPVSVTEELWESRARIERELGVAVDSIAYPFGSCDPVVEHLAAACGFRHGLTTEDRASEFSDRPLALARIEVFGQRPVDDFISRLPE